MGKLDVYSAVDFFSGGFSGMVEMAAGARLVGRGQVGPSNFKSPAFGCHR